MGEHGESRHTGPRRWEANTKRRTGRPERSPPPPPPPPAPVPAGQPSGPERPRPPGLPPRPCSRRRGEDAAGRMLPPPVPLPLRRRLPALPAASFAPPPASSPRPRRAGGRGHGLAPLRWARTCPAAEPRPQPPPPASASPPPPRVAPRFSPRLPPRRVFIAGGGDVRRTPLPGSPRGGTAALRAPRPPPAPGPAPSPRHRHRHPGAAELAPAPGAIPGERRAARAAWDRRGSARSWPRSCKSYRPEKSRGPPPQPPPSLAAGKRMLSPPAPAETQQREKGVSSAKLQSIIVKWVCTPPQRTQCLVEHSRL